MLAGSRKNVRFSWRRFSAFSATRIVFGLRSIAWTVRSASATSPSMLDFQRPSLKPSPATTLRRSFRALAEMRQVGLLRRGKMGFSLAVKLLFTGLTIAGFASLWGAIAADVGASLFVVLNGLRLLTRGEPPTS